MIYLYTYCKLSILDIILYYNYIYMRALEHMWCDNGRHFAFRRCRLLRWDKNEILSRHDAISVTVIACIGFRVIAISIIILSCGFYLSLLFCNQIRNYLPTLFIKIKLTVVFG